MWTVFGVILLIVSINDFLFFRIENEYISSIIVLYILSYICGISGNNFADGLIVATGVFIISLILNRFNLMGGGDVKLLFPVILFSGSNLSAFLFGLSIGGGFLAIVYMLYGRRIFHMRRNIIRFLLHRKRKKSYLLSIVLLSLNRIDKRIIELKKCHLDLRKQEIPYGIAISCGGFYVIVENFVVR